MDKNITQIIDLTLKEDHIREDISTSLLIPPLHKSTAYIVVKEKAVLCGLDIVRQIYKRIDPTLKFKNLCHDGQRVKPQRKIAIVHGSTRSILQGERVVLNFLIHLSGIATLTNLYIQKIKRLKTKIFDTRKTMPGLRVLEKYAVRCGGGKNHRPHLGTMLMIKDNHIAALKPQRSLKIIIARLRQKTNKPIEVEVENYKQFVEAYLQKPDIILLDNMKITEIQKMVKFHRQHKFHKHIQLEASGGVTLKTVRRLAQAGVDRISIGALTHSAKAIDISLEVMPNKRRRR